MRLKNNGLRLRQSIRLNYIQAAASAELRGRRQIGRTARTRKALFAVAFADDVERTVAAFAAKFHALRETGVAVGAGDDARHHARLRLAAAAAARMRRRRLAARRFPQRFQLRLNDLFIRAFADFDDALVVFFADFGDAQNVLTGGNSRQNQFTLTADAALALVVDVNFGINRRENYQTRSSGGFIF